MKPVGLDRLADEVAVNAGSSISACPASFAPTNAAQKSLPLPKNRQLSGCPSRALLYSLLAAFALLVVFSHIAI